MALPAPTVFATSILSACSVMAPLLEVIAPLTVSRLSSPPAIRSIVPPAAALLLASTMTSSASLISTLPVPELVNVRLSTSVLMSSPSPMPFAADSVVVEPVMSAPFVLSSVIAPPAVRMTAPEFVVIPSMPSMLLIARSSVSVKLNSALAVSRLPEIRSTSLPLSRSTVRSASIFRPPARVIEPAFALSSTPSSDSSVRSLIVVGPLATMPGLIAADTLICPAVVEPIRSTLPVIMSSSVSVRLSWLAVSVPRSISVPAVRSTMFTSPAPALICCWISRAS